jgi:hypothetical protein
MVFSVILIKMKLLIMRNNVQGKNIYYTLYIISLLLRSSIDRCSHDYFVIYFQWKCVLCITIHFQCTTSKCNKYNIYIHRERERERE